MEISEQELKALREVYSREQGVSMAANAVIKLLSTIDQLRGEREEIREAWEPFKEFMVTRTEYYKSFNITEDDNEVMGMVDGSWLVYGDLRKLAEIIGRE